MTVPTGFAIARLFGATSPITMCRKLISEKPTPNEILCATSSGTFSAWNSGMRIAATVGSPTQPSPRLAMVIPSCVADK